MADDPFSRVLGLAAGVVDRALVAAMHARGDRRADALPHAERLRVLGAIPSLYEGALDSFFARPPPVDLSLREVRHGVWETQWESRYEPFVGDVAEPYLSGIENRLARARFYFGPPYSPRTSKRPAVVAIHGYMGGTWLIEENQWPIEWLNRRGLDVVLPVLPFHAGRAGARRGAPTFPSADPRATNEGFRQAVSEVRTLVRFLRDRGAPHVGVMGMSLGGYTASLLATVVEEAEVDFVMPLIPLASLADFAREQGRLGSGSVADEQHAAIERAYAVASPFSRKARVPRERLLVVGAEHDRVTPISHARRLAAHFECDMRTVGGAHLIQLGRGDAFRALAQMLENQGIIAPKRGGVYPSGP